MSTHPDDGDLDGDIALPEELEDMEPASDIPEDETDTGDTPEGDD